MSKKATKAADNMYYLARCEAAENNDDFSSREKAAEIIGIDRTRLARIELNTIAPYPEEVKAMAEAYNTPTVPRNAPSAEAASRRLPSTILTGWR